MSKRFDKILGLLAGSAVGDCLGAPVEGFRRRDIVNRIGAVTNLFEIQEIYWYQSHPELIPDMWRMGGLHTDDTQMLLSIVECYLETGALKAEDLAEHFFQLFKVARGTGKGFRTYYKRYKKERCLGLSSNYPGAGAAMRAAGVTLTMLDTPDDEELLVKRIITQASITTHNTLSILAAVAMGAGAHIVLHFDWEKSPMEMIGSRFWNKVSKYVSLAQNLIPEIIGERLNEKEFKRDVHNYWMVSMSISRACVTLETRPRSQDFFHGIIDQIADEIRPIQERATGTRNHALEAPMTALFAFAMYGDEFAPPLLSAVNRGYDTDTVGAMVGQLSGAYHGFDPAWWQIDGDSFIMRNEKILRGEVIPIDWFLNLEAAPQLWTRACMLSGEEREYPAVMTIISQQEDHLPLYEFEHTLTLREREKRKEIKQYFGSRNNYDLMSVPRHLRGLRR